MSRYRLLTSWGHALVCPEVDDSASEQDGLSLRAFGIHDVVPQSYRGDAGWELAGMPALSDMDMVSGHPAGEAKLVTDCVKLCAHEARRPKRAHADGHRRCGAALIVTASAAGAPQQRPLTSRGTAPGRRKRLVEGAAIPCTAVQRSSRGRAG